MAETALAIDKNCRNAWLNKGNVLYMMGDPSNAMKSYNHVIKLANVK